MDILFTLLIAYFVFVPILRWHAAWVLWQARDFAVRAHGPSGTLTERLIVAISGAVGSTLLALGGINLFLGFPVALPAGLITIVALALFSVPAVVWEWMFRTGKLFENIENISWEKELLESIKDVGDKADAAYHEANQVNLKIANLDKRLVEQGEQARSDRARRSG